MKIAYFLFVINTVNTLTSLLKNVLSYHDTQLI